MEKMLIDLAHKHGISVSPAQALLMSYFFQLVLEYNKKFNLTSIVDKREASIRHFVDSILITKVIQFKVGDEVIDIGAGAGFPGIPLKIMAPGISIYLLESSRKKVIFLQDVIAKLQLLSAEVLHGRAESLGHEPELRERFRYATARAVAPLSVLSEFALPFIRIGGKFLAYKGRGVDQEIIEAREAINTCGGKIIACHFERIEGQERVIVVVEKVNKSPAHFSRRPGIPKKRPIR